MNLQERIVQDLHRAMKTYDVELISSLRVIVREIQRQSKSHLSDKEVIKVLKKLKKEHELLALAGKTSRFLEVATGYIPSMATEEEISIWAKKNLDFTVYKSRTAAIKAVLACFGVRTNVVTVKKLLSRIVKANPE